MGFAVEGLILVEETQTPLRYTFKPVKKIILVLVLSFLVVSLVSLGFADETSFSRVKVPDSKGRQTKAVLIFSYDHKAIEVRPAKGNTVSISYAAIDKCSYEYTH